MGESVLADVQLRKIVLSILRIASACAYLMLLQRWPSNVKNSSDVKQLN